MATIPLGNLLLNYCMCIVVTFAFLHVKYRKKRDIYNFSILNITYTIEIIFY